MAKNFLRSVGERHFSGQARVHDSADRADSLTAHVRRIYQSFARERVRRANFDQLTDSSGGTAAATYKSADSGALVANDLTGLTTGVTAASLNAAADTVMNAYAVIMERLNDAVFTPLGAGSADEGPGTIAASGTIAAVDDTATANSDDTDAASAASANAVRRDLLHAQRTVIGAIDDARVAVGLAPSFPRKRGRLVVGSGETFVFADDNPDTITRDVGSWADDGFLPGDVIHVAGTELNNTGDVRGGGSQVNQGFTIATLTATVLTLVAADELAAETVDATEAIANGFEIVVAKRVDFPGRLAGATPGPDLDETDAVSGAVPAGADWTFEFEGTGGTAIADAANVDPPSAAVLLADWDAFVDELSDNIALMADKVDEITNPGVPAGDAAPKVHTVLGFVPQTEYAAGTSIFVSSPVRGRIRNVRAVVIDEVTAGIGSITFELNGVAVTGAALTVPDMSIIGAFVTDAVADTGTNIVEAGQRIEIVGDGTPTAGALQVFIEIEEIDDPSEAPLGFAQ